MATPLDNKTNSIFFSCQKSKLVYNIYKDFLKNNMEIVN